MGHSFLDILYNCKYKFTQDKLRTLYTRYNFSSDINFPKSIERHICFEEGLDRWVGGGDYSIGAYSGEGKSGKSNRGRVEKLRDSKNLGKT